jgi:hypothetical protein
MRGTWTRPGRRADGVSWLERERRPRCCTPPCGASSRFSARKRAWWRWDPGSQECQQRGTAQHSNAISAHSSETSGHLVNCCHHPSKASVAPVEGQQPNTSSTCRCATSELDVCGVLGGFSTRAEGCTCHTRIRSRWRVVLTVQCTC